jgi:hypothetical protein
MIKKLNQKFEFYETKCIDERKNLQDFEELSHSIF